MTAQVEPWAEPLAGGGGGQNPGRSVGEKQRKVAASPQEKGRHPGEGLPLSDHIFPELTSLDSRASQSNSHT